MEGIHQDSSSGISSDLFKVSRGVSFDSEKWNFTVSVTFAWYPAGVEGSDDLFSIVGSYSDSYS